MKFDSQTHWKMQIFTKMIFKFRMNYVTLYLNAYHLVSVKYLLQQSAYDIEHRDQLRKKMLLVAFLFKTVKFYCKTVKNETYH